MIKSSCILKALFYAERFSTSMSNFNRKKNYNIEVFPKSFRTLRYSARHRQNLY